jgi:hypothetical protein
MVQESDGSTIMAKGTGSDSGSYKNSLELNSFRLLQKRLSGESEIILL